MSNPYNDALKSDLQYVLDKPADKRTQADRDYLEMYARQELERLKKRPGMNDDALKAITDQLREQLNPTPRMSREEELRKELGLEDDAGTDTGIRIFRDR